MKIDNKIIRAVLQQIDQDLSNRAVARHLGISPTTVAKIRNPNLGNVSHQNYLRSLYP